MINVMDEYVSYTVKCFHKYFKMIYGNKYDKKLSSEFIDSYINVRYSNYIDEYNKKLSLQRKISKVLDDTTKELLSENDKSKENIINSLRIFTGYFYNLDQLYLLESQKKTIDKISEDRCKIFGIEDDDFTSSFSEALREDIKKRKEYLESFDSNMFELDYKKMTKNELLVELKNNIVFPELYSDVAIAKAAAKDSISEDLTAILFLQISSVIVNDLISCDFDKTYYAFMPNSFFDKKVKVARLFNIIDNIFVQDRFRVVISYECFVRYKTYVTEFMRNGFIFALYLDDSFDYSSKNIEFLELFDKILLNSSKYYYKDMKNNGKIKDRIVNIDEVK